MRRINSDFKSRGDTCSGWLYLPDRARKHPVVIMAHGMAAEKTFALPRIAGRFAREGMAAYLFDYRNFGGSTGRPRNLVNPFRHVNDWRRAIAHVRRLKEVDGDRIALWGTSFSGGHVLVAAAEMPGIRAVVSQIPFVDGIATAFMFDTAYRLKAVYHGLKDLARCLTFREPHCIPVVAEPGNIALMNTPESKRGYLALVPKGSAWENKAPARAILLTLAYSPQRYASGVSCPVLVVYAEKDSLIPWKAVHKTAQRMPDAREMRLEGGHFDVYFGKMFEKVTKAECDFLRACLNVKPR